MKTTKLYLAAALIAQGAGKVGVDRGDPKHMKFILSFSSPVADEDEWFSRQVEAWENNTLTVNAKDFVDAIQDLKSEVHK